MSAVARLVLSYFTRTPGLRWLSLAGVAGIVAGAILLPHIATNGLTSVIVFLGCVTLFIGAGLMPMMVAHMALSHAVCVLPYGRLRLFLSAFVTVTIVSIPLPLLGAIGQLVMTPESALAPYTSWQLFGMLVYLFWSFYVSTFLVATWLFVAIGLATTERNAAGLTQCLLVIIAVIYTPSQRIVKLDPQFELTAWESILSWAAIGAWIAYAPRLRGRSPLAAFGNLVRRAFRRRRAARYSAGHEFDLLLGTARPWVLVLAMLFPIAIQTLVGFKLPSTWLLYFALFSAVSGALAGCAAERSRSLWLRARWSREELFAHVERAFWKHDSYVLAALVMVLVAVARMYGLPARVVPLGIPLLVLGTMLSTYLGLLMTRGLQWPEASLAITIVLALMGVAVLAANERSDTRIVIALEAVLGLVALVLRFAARRRWHRLDWMLCRAERTSGSLRTDT